MRRLSAEIRRPVTFALLQVDAAPELWRELLALSEAAAAEGAQVYPQVAGRPFGMLVGHQTKIHPFAGRPSFEKLLALPFAERVKRLREPETKRAILAEGASGPRSLLLSQLSKFFPMGDPPRYEPTREESVAGLAERAGRDPEELLYDRMLARDGKELFLVPVLNYSQGSCDPIREMMLHPFAALGLGDGGAHCGIICDASIQTFVLTHWVRDRTRGPKLPVELAVKRMTRDTAALYGFADRGTLAPGQRADLNLIDLARLTLEPPEMVADLPAGGQRFLQRARGYRATFVAGEQTIADDEPTGALPGRLVRGS
jgi:N-acyl-D-aspartate/D-glutamate deacylase